MCLVLVVGKRTEELRQVLSGVLESCKALGDDSEDFGTLGLFG